MSVDEEMTELQGACAILRDRESAEEARRILAEAGIEARIATPSPDRRGLRPGSWEIHVPASRVAEAHALLIRSRDTTEPT